MLRHEPDMQVVAEVEDGREAVRQAVEVSPDVVVMDISMPGLNGIDATRQIRTRLPQAHVVALTAHGEPRMASEMLAAGADGFVLKDDAFEELAGAIRAAMQGKTYVSPRISAALPDQRQLKPNGGAIPSAFAMLTPREREVLQLMSEGKATKEVAFHLGLSVKTVETYRRQISEKLNLHSVAELTKYAIREGITSL